MTIMNSHAAIARGESERTNEGVRDEMNANASGSTATDGATPERPHEEFVRTGEFRLFKWFAGLALAAILSGMGLLYQGLADQRVAMDRQFADLRAEMHAGFSAITAHVDSRFDGVDSRFDSVDSRFDSVNSRFDSVNSRFDRMDSRFDRMDSKIAALERDVADVRERLARVETLLDAKNREDLPD